MPEAVDRTVQFEGPAPIRFLMSDVVPFVSGKEKNQASSPLALDPAVQQRINDAAEAWAAPFLPAR